MISRLDRIRKEVKEIRLETQADPGINYKCRSSIRWALNEIDIQVEKIKNELKKNEDNRNKMV